jgi:type IV pilus assembly protein PilB
LPRIAKSNYQPITMPGMATHRMRLGELLLSLKLVSKKQLDRGLELQKESPAPLGSILVGLGYITEDQLLNALAAQMGVSPWRLDEQPPKNAAVARVPSHIARTYQVLPVDIRGDLMLLGMRNPLDVDAIDLIHNMTSMRIEPVLVDSDRLVRSIEDAYSSVRPEPTSMDKLIMEAINDFNPDAPVVRTSSVDTKEADSKPVVTLVNNIIGDAIRLGASDIHIEPRGKRVDVRYRVDGDLRRVREIPLAILPMLTTRMKIMAELDIVEFRIPQDGRFSVKIDDREVDIRMSVLPNHHGQRVVLRVLDKSVSLKKLPDLGFTESHLATFKDLIQKPYGMLLVTGPTGSGKTTTLYAALADIKNERSNIMTCEDPIEYEIEGINQSQVFEKVGLTFAAQLRAILRQDPDVILVGEIRDGETAQTAIRASMTGHLVLSTLHCNDAPSAVPRLLDMGADPFLLSTSVIGVMSQRLIKKLCPHCKESAKATEEELAQLITAFPGLDEDFELCYSTGCHKCENSGFRGRTAVQEIMPVTAEVARAISNHESLDVIREVAAASGYRPMQHAAMAMVIAGETTLAEASRHVYFDSFASSKPALRLAA